MTVAVAGGRTGLVGLPLAFGVAILRYRLHDIDLIISVTVVYGILTAVLVCIFEIMVVTPQHAPLVLAHVEESQLAYFATAMVMAASFEPLKRRIDALVERRWLRKDGRTTGRSTGS